MCDSAEMIVFVHELQFFVYLQKTDRLVHCCSRPIKAAVAAVAEHLAGLVETQLTYSHAHQNTAQVCFRIAHFLVTTLITENSVDQSISKPTFNIINLKCSTLKLKSSVRYTNWYKDAISFYSLLRKLSSMFST